MLNRNLFLFLFALSSCAPPLSSFLNKGDCAPNKDGLSLYGSDVLTSISQTSVMRNSTVSEKLLLTSCNSMEQVLIDGPEIFSVMRDEIALAKHEVDIAFYKWNEASQAADKIGAGIKAAESSIPSGQKLLVRILVDDFSVGPDRAMDNVFNSVENWGLNSSKVEVQISTYPHLAQGVLHDKYVVIDTKTVIVTGAQPETSHDAPTPWHDTGYIFRGDVGLSVTESFDEAWNGNAQQYHCEQRTGFNCRETSTKFPKRPWLDSIDRKAGAVNLLVTTRVADGSINNQTNNPQDQAWLSVFKSATRNINVITPNINDDAFNDAVIDAVRRGVSVNIITSKGFNQYTENFPGQGGDNQEVVGKLRQRIRELNIKNANLKICWFSRDGVSPIDGKERASHTKYLTVDGKISIIGSGNMDTQSWNNSRELNVMIDSEAETNELEERIFAPDLAMAICSLVELYEGNNAQEDLIASESITTNRIYNFAPGLSGDNDEARSLVLYDCPAGKVFRLYDDPDKDRSDDWLEIIVKRHLGQKVIGTFEQTNEDDDVRLIYHRNNGLDGKVSVLEVSDTPTGPIVDLYEGDNGTQNLLCAQPAVNDRVIYFQQPGSCDNDEARSLILYDMTPGKVITLYDDPGTAINDDWLEIVVKRAFKMRLINTLENSFDDADLKVTYHSDDNDLQGKVSSLKFSSNPIGPVIDLYEGNSGLQNLVCSISGTNRNLNFQTGVGCTNDEARSIVLYDYPADKAILLFDSPDGDTEDDWTLIRTKRSIDRRIVPSFESNEGNDDVDVFYFGNDDDLDGKVSRVEIKNFSEIPSLISFYEGNNGGQNKVCELAIRDRTVNFQNHSSCDNDEARSAILSFVEPGTVIRLYDDPGCSTNDDWLRIEVKQYVSRYIINSFENSFENSRIKATYHSDNGLDGKVSCVKIARP